jgi:hypothetical protein
MSFSCIVMFTVLICSTVLGCTTKQTDLGESPHAAAAADSASVRAAAPRKAEAIISMTADSADSSPPEPDDVSTPGCLGELGLYPSDQFTEVRSFDPSALRGELGEPMSQKTWSAPDRREPGLVDEFIELAYSDLTITATRFQGQSEYWLERLSLRSASTELPCGLRFGALVSLSALPSANIIGPSAEIPYYWSRFWQEGDVNYAAHATITVRTSAEGKLAAIEWYFYPD